MNIQTIVKSLRGAQTNTVDALRNTLDAIDIEALENAAGLLEADRRRILLDGSDKDLEAIETKIAAANRDIERAYAAKEELERRIEAATVAKTQQQRSAQYTEAKAQADAAAKLITKEYPDIGKRFVALIKTLAEAQAAVEEANRNLPEGASALTDPEVAVRAKLGEPERTLKTETVSVWCYSNAHDIQVLPQEKQDELDARYRGSDQGSLSSGSAGGMISVTRRRLIRRSYLPRTQHVLPDRLVNIRMPGLKVGDPFVWDAPDFPEPRSVLANVARLAALRPAPAVNPADVMIEYLDPNDAEQSNEIEVALA